jgi:hypothetical protein
MVNMTLAIPKETHAKMKQHNEIKWTEVAREAIQTKLALLEAEKNPLRQYAYKRLVEEGEDPDKLFKL